MPQRPQARRKVKARRRRKLEDWRLRKAQEQQGDGGTDSKSAKSDAKTS